MGTKQLGLVPGLPGVTLFEPESEQVMYVPQGASGGKTQERSGRDLEAPGNWEHWEHCRWVWAQQESSVLLRSLPCLLVFNQRPELVYHKIQTWCQAAASPVSDDRCFPADGGRTVPTSQVFTGAAVINGGGAGREEAEGTP